MRMNKLLRIGLYIGLVLFVYLGVTSIFKGCGSGPDTQQTGLIVEGGDEEYDIFDTPSDDVLLDLDGNGDAVATADDDGIDYTGIDEELEKPLSIEEKATPPPSRTPDPQSKQPTPDPRTPTKKQPTASTTSGSSSTVRQTSRTTNDGTGKYMVLAGSYLVKDNADKMVQRLRSKGYAEAEIVQFDGNKYHSVCAVRSDDYDVAAGKSNALKRSGIDSYVHTRQ